ncbi:tetratricopeptide repeat protein [Thiohalophilus sp.]|uniref:tetratricopeptide repeat protein n=1 Tax=Thiohalophilus sp. TaxID=3028392 RepID=UPI002ACE78AB|nr:tetratricopeptide repeat protein [Thiohalophilus sp.]MDZ7661431.1 tetratricopeptide repeat protein [Thiohalophilus sp.]
MPPGRTVRFSLSLCLLLFSALTGAFAAPVGQAEFERGVAASQRGEHQQAIQAYLQAQRAGFDQPALQYNLGVSYFRLGDYAKAAQQFAQLTRDPQWAALAHYNLGLVARRLDQPDRAADHFEQAYRRSDNARLRALAASALDRLPGTRADAGTTLSATVAAGYDSNVALAPDAETVNLSDNSDLFIEAGAVVNHRLSADSTRARYLFGGLHLRQYLDVSEFDQQSLRLGFNQEQILQRWQLDLRAYLDNIHVDSDRFEQSLNIAANARRTLGGGRDLRLHYQAGLIDGGARYAYLDGWEQRLGIDSLLPTGAGWLRFGYQLELNDRDDLEQNGEFFSYSPTRHSLFARLTLPDAGHWRYTLRGEYRYSDYDDPYRISNGTGTTEVPREDHRYLVGIRAQQRLADRTALFVDYRYIDNDSNITAYDYARHQVMGGIEARY